MYKVVKEALENGNEYREYGIDRGVLNTYNGKSKTIRDFF